MDAICVPIHLDALAVSPGSCNGPSNLAPYTQPNYTSLRLDSHVIKHDVLDHVDFHLASPAWRNPRLADIGKEPGNPPGQNLRLNRMGVHLAWSLPRFYRAGQASGKSATSSTNQVGATDPNPNPVFRAIPNRWLVTRHLINYRDENKLPEWQSWVIESDVIRRISDRTSRNQMGDSMDIESEVSPFISYRDNSDDVNLLKAQTEIFLGQKFGLNDPWREVSESEREHMPKLTIASSSNPVFADNALHNANVLSMIDDLAYPDSAQPTGFGHLKKASCDYFVVGWHSRASDDPFNDDKLTLGSRLQKFFLRLDDGLDATVKENLNTSLGPRRTLSHGAIYGVQYDFSYDPNSSKTRSLVNETAVNFTKDVKMEPLSIGTTPLDSILTFLEAHKADTDQVFGAGATSITDSLLDMAQLLYAQGDNYDSRIRAQDLIAQQNFSNVDGGMRWVFAKTTTPGQPTQTPGTDDNLLLAKLNNFQSKLDTAQRELLSLRWDLFAEWWKYVSKYIPLNEQQDVDNKSKGAVDRLAQQIVDMEKLIVQLQGDIQSNQNPVTCKLVAGDAFYTRIDPTLCIAGLQSGWPSDWQDTLSVRVSSQFISNTDDVRNKIFGSSNASNPVPTDFGLDKAALGVLGECLTNAGTTNGNDGKPKVTGFLQWANTNPFVPLFIEWEGVYYHVGPFEEKWDVRLRPSPVGHAHPTLRYVPTGVLSEKDENHTDFRSVSGRVMVLPQPVFSLETIVMQILDTPGIDTGLNDAQKKDLRDHIRQIQFVSAPLSGLTNHLLTRFEGSHVKPNVRVQGGRSVVPLQAAVRSVIDLDKTTLSKIDGESALTPYGDSFPFSTDQYPGVPFKPVTHGQLVLTKLNIIDKFGQAVCLPKTLRRPRVPPLIPATNIFPCLSDSLAPDIMNNTDPNVKTKTMNTIFPTAAPVEENKWPLCQYIELTPAINQGAKISSSFLFRQTIDQDAQNYSDWKEATDYDPMVWGWVIINYADNGLQFFLGDGTFYREIRRGGVSGTNLSLKWLPYDPPAKPDIPQNAGEVQLAQLIERLKDVKYFQRFSEAINQAIQNMPFAPSEYSGYANAIIGKPLALVNVGWSIELSQPAIKSQNTLGNPANDPYKTLHEYSFPLKIGDVERNYDGVVGYWMPDPSNQNSTTIDFNFMNTYFVTLWSNLPTGTLLYLPSTKNDYKVVDGDTLTLISDFQSIPTATIKAANPQIADASWSSLTKDTILHLPTIYVVRVGETLESICTSQSVSAADVKNINPTIPDANAGDSFRAIAPGNFIKLNPYYTSPIGTDDIVADRVSNYKVTSVLMDPYTSIHGYSPILPTKSLTLPAYAVHNAFQKMHAFFHLGPILLTQDVPRTKGEAKGQSVSLPISGAKGTWEWFQPYADASASVPDPTYAEMQVLQDPGTKRYEKPPYTFVEGFLQLMGSLEQKISAGTTIALTPMPSIP